MSIAIVQVGAYTGSINTSLSIDYSLTGVTSGNAIITPVNVGQASGVTITLAVADAQGAYSQDSLTQRGNQLSAGIYSLFNANAGTHNLVATATGGSSTTTSWGVAAMEVSGLGTTNSLDQATGASQNPGTTPTTGTTSALAQGSELVVVSMTGNGGNLGGGTYPPTGGNNSPFISIFSKPTGSPGGLLADCDYQINTSATTAVEGAWGTLSTSQMNVGTIATYKAATASAAFRKTLSSLGTRIGSRQIQL